MTVIYNNKYPQHDRRLRCRQRDQSREPDIILNGGHLDEALLLQRTFKEQNVNAKIFGYSSDGYAGLPQDTRQRRELGFAARSGRDGEVSGRGRVHQRSKVYARSSTRSTATSGLSQRGVDRGVLGSSTRSRNRSLDPLKVRDALQALDVVTFYGILKSTAAASTCTTDGRQPDPERQLDTVWRSASKRQAMYPTPAGQALIAASVLLA